MAKPTWHTNDELEVFFDASPEPHFILDHQGVFLALNAAAEKLTGYKADRLVGRSFRELGMLPPQASLQADGRFEEVAEGGRLDADEYALVRSDGTQLYVLVQPYQVNLASGRFVVAVVRDISRRKQAEIEIERHRENLERIVEERTGELKASEDRFRFYFEYAPDAFYLINGQGTILDGNRAAEKLVGYPREELIGEGLSGILPPDQFKKAMELLVQDLLGVPSGPNEYLLRHKDGQLIPVEVSTHPSTLRDEKVVLGIARDIRERKRAEEERGSLEEQLRHAQKMEAVGLLAGGVAHDMNNVLGSIMSVATLMRETGKGSDESLSDIDDILEACRRGRDLTQNLLGFARKGRVRRERFSLTTVVDEVVALLTRTIPKTVTLDVDIAEALGRVEGDPSQMTLALMNICLNAMDAMKRQGALSITAQEEQLDEVFVASKVGYNLAPGPYARLIIKDTGHGMNQKIMARVFDPFFTTKERGEGTGLGLSMVYGTIKSHSGLVELESEPGKGTIVTIFLPIVDHLKNAIQSDVDEQRVPAPSQQTILLVDDEDILRRAGRRLLEHLGYTVLMASNGEEALEVFDRHQESISLVLLDLIMPTMDGEETFRNLRKRSADLKILLVSGFSRDGKAEELITEGAAGFIQKPFELGTLSSTIARVLSSD